MRAHIRHLAQVAVVGMASASLVACGTSRDGGASAEGCDPGITDTSIKFGQSSLQSGAGAAYKPFATVPAKFFDEINADGGAEFGDGKKRKIEFISLDDNYDPAQTVVNVRRLVEQDQVFAMVHNTGTASLLASIDYLSQQGVPLLLSGSGADELREKYAAGEAMIIDSALPSVSFENRVFIESIAAEDPDAKLAILYPNDGLGTGQLENINELIADTDLEIVGQESYELTAPTVDSQVSKLRQSDADVFIHLGTGAFVTGALKKLNELSWHPEKWVISASVDTASIINPAGQGAAQNLNSVMWIYGVAEGENEDVPGVQEWRTWAKAHGEDDTSIVAAESYHDMQLLMQVLANMEGCKRTDLFEAAKNTTGMTSSLSLPGLTFGPTEDDPSAVTSLARLQWEGDGWTYGEVVESESR